MLQEIAKQYFQKQIPVITTDSRKVVPGCLFVAILGDVHDGHTFIPQAIEKGATSILAEKSKLTPELKSKISNSVKVFEVESTLIAIRAIAAEYRTYFKIPFIGIVGSVGKTTTKEMVAAILTGKYSNVLKTEGSQNGFLGIAITLLDLKPEHQAAVIEIGIDEIGAMEQHLNLVQPDILICTATGPEHLHQLKTVEIAAEEELKAFDYGLKHGKKIAVNLDDSFVSEYAHAKGLTARPEPKVKFYQLSKNAESKLENGILEHEQNSFALPLPGIHHARNLLGAITVAELCGLSVNEIKNGLTSFKTAYGRTNIVEKHLTQLPAKKFTLIEDYYNSNPTSCEAALKLLASSKKEPNTETIAALGDMLELGEQEEKFHRNLAQTLIKLNTGHVYLYGPRMKWLKDELEKNHFSGSFQHFETHDELAKDLKTRLTHLNNPIALLLKGSRGMKMETILKFL